MRHGCAVDEQPDIYISGSSRRIDWKEKGMTREEQKRLKELKKELTIAEKTLSKDLGFKRSHDFTFCFIGEFAYWVSVNVNNDGSALLANISVKSTLLDNLFWNVFEIPENHNQPKSFHIYGAFVSPFFCLTNQYNVSLENGVEIAYTNILSQANQTIKQYGTTLKTITDFQNLIKDEPYQKLNFVLCEIYLGNKENAEKLIQEAVDNDDHGGFSCEGRSIYEYAKAYLEKQ